MKKVFPFLFLFSAFHVSFGQSDCSGGRYLNEIFTTVDLTSDLQFGSNVDLNNATTDLFLDIYEPQGDTSALRPLMVWAHGGSFVGGSKTGTDVVPLCQTFAKRGYVTTSIDYRLGMSFFPNPPDSVDGTEAVMRAVHDAKAAVRWFYKSAQNGNPYRIDTTRIIMGGVSAGGFVALHYAYLDDMSEYPSWVDSTGPGLGGGLSGTSGNPGYSENILGVVNVCGALGKLNWMQSGDEPVVSLHGTNDQTVPYGTDLIYLLGIYPIMEVNGSSTVHQNANTIGLENCFYTYYGADHVPHVGNAAYTDTTVNVIKDFLIGVVCGNQSSTCAIQTGLSSTMSKGKLEVFPVPSADEVKIRIPAGISGELSLLDMQGRTVLSKSLNGSSEVLIQRNGMSRGLYLLTLQSAQGRFTGKVVWE